MPTLPFEDYDSLEYNSKLHVNDLLHRLQTYLHTIKENPHSILSKTIESFIDIFKKTHTKHVLKTLKSCIIDMSNSIILTPMHKDNVVKAVLDELRMTYDVLKAKSQKWEETVINSDHLGLHIRTKKYKRHQSIKKDLTKPSNAQENKNPKNQQKESLVAQKIKKKHITYIYKKYRQNKENKGSRNRRDVVPIIAVTPTISEQQREERCDLQEYLGIYTLKPLDSDKGHGVKRTKHRRAIKKKVIKKESKRKQVLIKKPRMKQIILGMTHIEYTGIRRGSVPGDPFSWWGRNNHQRSYKSIHCDRTHLQFKLVLTRRTHHNPYRLVMCFTMEHSKNGIIHAVAVKELTKKDLSLLDCDPAVKSKLRSAYDFNLHILPSFPQAHFTLPLSKVMADLRAKANDNAKTRKRRKRSTNTNLEGISSESLESHILRREADVGDSQRPHLKDAFVEQGQEKLLSCMGKKTIIDPTVTWEDSEMKPVADARLLSTPAGDLKISDAQAKDSGLYTCIAKGKSREGQDLTETHRYMVVVYHIPKFSYKISLKYSANECQDAINTVKMVAVKEALCPNSTSCIFQDFTNECHFTKSPGDPQALKYELWVSFFAHTSTDFSPPKCEPACIETKVIENLELGYKKVQDFINAETATGEITPEPKHTTKEVSFECPPGFGTQGILCETCVPGEYSGAKDKGCIKCNPGTYQPSHSMTKCFDCPPKTNTTKSGSRTKGDCTKVAFIKGNMKNMVTKILARGGMKDIETAVPISICAVVAIILFGCGLCWCCGTKSKAKPSPKPLTTSKTTKTKSSRPSKASPPAPPYQDEGNYYSTINSNGMQPYTQQASPKRQEPPPLPQRYTGQYTGQYYGQQGMNFNNNYQQQTELISCAQPVPISSRQQGHINSSVQQGPISSVHQGPISSVHHGPISSVQQ
ncbi:unnamed protein product, partial [Owenia fusiformis]